VRLRAWNYVRRTAVLRAGGQSLESRVRTTRAAGNFVAPGARPTETGRGTTVNNPANATQSVRTASPGSAVGLGSPAWSSRQPGPAPSPDPDRIRRALTEREKQILRLVCDGLSNAEIADRLSISPETVKSELKRIFRKIEVKNRTQAAVLLIREGLL